MPGAIRIGDMCFAKGTMIAMLSGVPKKIEDITKGDWVYSIDKYTNKIVPGEVRRSFSQGHHEVVEVTLDNGEIIECTPDHRFMRRNGRLESITSIGEGESLMPLYRMYDNIGSRGYEKIRQPNGEWEFTHKMIRLWKGGHSKLFNTSHHRDFNSRNNMPSNITICRYKDHWQYHSKMKSAQLKVAISLGLHPWQLPHLRERGRHVRAANAKWLIPGYWDNKFANELKNNGAIGWGIHNRRDNPMNHQMSRDKMVSTRRQHHLGYHYGKNYFDTEQCAKEVSERMIASNPMKDPNVKLKMGVSRSAKLRGYASAQLLIDEIIGCYNIGTTIEEIMKQYKFTKEKVEYCIFNNHKVISIKYIKKVVEVYDLEIDTTHNFALQAGVFVSNSSGHGCFAPNVVITGNPKVIIEGKPASCIGDMLVPHACGPLIHPGNIASGAPKVIVGGRPLGIVGSMVSCGEFMAMGSIKVRINEASSIPQVPDSVIMPDGSEVIIPDEYKGLSAYEITYEAGKYAMFDEEDEIAATPSTLKDDTPKSTTVNGTPKSVLVDSPIEDNKKQTPAATGKLSSCFTIVNVDYEFQLSTHFRLADFSTRSLFKHTIKAQAGFSEKEIICNLQGLAQEVLENIWNKYPGFRINSGFRTFTVGKSQHEKGQACDIQWPGISNQEYKVRANWIRDNIVYDLLLFEHGNAIWIHLSFNRTRDTQRKEVKTMFKGKFQPGIVLYYN